MDPISRNVAMGAAGAGAVRPIALANYLPAADLGLYTWSMGNGSIFFKPDDPTLVTYKSGAALYQFRTKIAHNLSGAVPTGSFTLAADYDCHISPDGTRLYELIFGANGNFAVKASTLSTPWNLSTVTASYTHTPSYGLVYNTPRRGIAFSTDGTKMFICDQSTYFFYWTLTTPWDVRTAGTANNFTFSSTYLEVRNLTVSSEGTKIYMSGSNQQAYPLVAQISLSTAWNPGSTRTFTYHTVGGVSSQNYPEGAFGISPDGRTVYHSLTVGNRNTGTNEAITTVSNNLATAWNLTGWSCRGTTGNTYLGLSSFWPSVNFAYDIRGWAIRPNGTEFYFTKGNGSGKELYKSTLSTPFNFGTMSTPSAIYGSESILTGYGMYFRPDGLGFYLGNEYYTTPTPWVFTNPTRAHTYATAGSNPVLDPTGTKYYLSTASGIVQSTLTTPWNIATGTVAGTLSGVSGAFRIASNGGSFVLASGATVKVYALSTPWNITSATLEAEETYVGQWSGNLELCNDDTLLVLGLYQDQNPSYTVIRPYRYNSPIGFQAVP
jgi:hypothetical protein